MIRLQRLDDLWLHGSALAAAHGFLRIYVLRRTRYSLFALIVPCTAAQDKQAKGHVARQDEKDARLRCVGGTRRARKGRF